MKNLTLLTDLYELTMMQGYFKTNNNKRVIFDYFYRKNPFNSGYSICCGLHSVIDYILNLHFTKEDIDYLKSLNIFDDDFLSYLSNFKFTGDVYAVKEGSVIFPQEPIIKVVAPIIEAQLIESALLNFMNHQSLIATKAARIVNAATPRGVLEFGLRRAQGASAAILGSRAAVIAGAVGTSNVVSAKDYNLPLSGTHAHSWVMSFDDELTAFFNYAKLYPNNLFLLVDTYDTLKSGMKNAIKVFKYLKERNELPKRYGVRLDSGDLSYLTKVARTMLDEAGFFEALICVSGDLDEYLIESLISQGAKIDIFGIGTKLITAYDNPAFGGVYKLVAIKDKDDFIPKIKISDNSLKITNPGDKKVYRIYGKDGKIFADLIALSSEKYDENDDLLLFSPKEPWKRTKLLGGEYKMKELLIPIFKNGELVYSIPTTSEIVTHCKKDVKTLWEEVKRMMNPHEVHIDLSKPLYDLKNKLLFENK